MHRLYGTVPVMRQFFPHLKKFSMYVLSGCTAVLVDIVSYFFLIHVGMWYIGASVLSDILALIMAFLLHKYVVFQKHETFMRHFCRYVVVDVINMVIITGILYGLVDIWGADPRSAKIVALVPAMLWNFFVYKLVVYV